MSQRQTQSYLQNRLEQAGLRPQQRFGQNFLIDLNLLDLIVRSADLDKRDVVLEIGCGTGSLTTRMAPEAGWVISVEIDPMVAQLAAAEIAGNQNVTLLQQDALKNKNQLSSVILDEIRSRMASIPDSRLKLVANLPYNVATPIVSNLLQVDPWPSLMVVTIQKELAERITAKPRTKDYSALSIWIQSQCHAEIVRTMPPSVFWPRPKVDSAILKIRPDRALQSQIKDLDFFHTTVRALYFHRRKFLRGVLVSAMKEHLDKPAIDALLDEMQFGPNARAEELSIEQTIELIEKLRAKLSQSA